MSRDPLLDSGAAALAAALGRGEITSTRATEAYLARVGEHERRINAFTAVTAAAAREAAAASDTRRRRGQTLGPMDGVPIAIKDNIDVAGVPTTAGMALYRDTVAMEDAPCVAALRAAGMVILGKTAMPEGALGATTETATFGRCNNPLAEGYTPGGSSGGSGAAVAAGFVPAALGTDTMGSVRVPAAYCGLYGIKPTKGLVSGRGVVPLSWHYDHVGILARQLADLAPILSIAAAPDPRDQDGVQPPTAWTPFPPAGPSPLRGRRFGVPRQAIEIDLDAEVRVAFDHCTTRLRQAGAIVEEVAVDGWKPSETRRAALLVCEAEAFVYHEAARKLRPDGIAAEFARMLDYGASQPASRLVKAARLVGLAAIGFDIAAAGYDAMLMPTTPQRAFRHDAAIPLNLPDLTAIANFTGRSAVCLPVAVPGSPLPASVQLIGPRFGEANLIALGQGIDEIL